MYNIEKIRFTFFRDTKTIAKRNRIRAIVFFIISATIIAITLLAVLLLTNKGTRYFIY